MVRSLLLTLLLAAAAGALHAQVPPPGQGATLSGDMEAIARFSPRPEGSSGEKELTAWIEARLGSIGVPFAPFDFSRSDFEHSFSTCLRVDLPGASPDTLIVVVPLNNPALGAQGGDGSINVALALDLIERTKGTMPPLSLTILFLGAEFGDTAAYPMGSTLFLRDFQPDYRVAVLYLNLRGEPDRVLVRGGGRGIVTPYWLMDRCVNALRGQKIPMRLQGDETQIFRMGTTDERTLIEPYLAAGYPSVVLEGELGPELPAHETELLSSLSGFLYEFLSASGSGIPDEWDRHYVLLQAGDLSLIVGEKPYVIALLAALGGTLLYSLLFRKGLKKYLRTLARNLPAIVPLAGLSFLFLLAGTCALQWILARRGFPTLWTYAPLAFLGLKVCVALFLYAALYNLFRRLPFPRNGSFYSAAALFFLLVDIVVVAAFNISFACYFLWAFVFVFLSALVPNRNAKVLLFLPAPLWGLRGLITVFTTPALPFARFLLLSPFWGNLLAAGVCLPFILVLLRLGLVFPGRGILRRRMRELVLAGALLLAGGALTVRLLTFTPFTSSNPRPVAAVQTIEVSPAGAATSSSLEISSPAPLGRLAVSDADGARTIDAAGTSMVLSQKPLDPPVTISMDSSSFLRQRNVTLLVAMPSSPRHFSIVLSSDQDFVLFDSSFPSLRESPREYRLLIGAFPPNPLPLQLTLPADGAFTLTMTMDFDAPLLGAEVSAGPDARVATRVRLVRSLDVKT
jgi:hypothetical protein